MKMKMNKFLGLTLAAVLLATAGSPRFAYASGTPSDSSLDSEAGASLEEAAEGADSAARVSDGSRSSGRVPAVEAGRSEPIRRSGGPGSLGRASFKPITPKAEDAPTYGKAAKGTWDKLKPTLSGATQLLAIGGVCFFLFGMLSLSLPMMMGGALAAVAGILISGIIQSGVLETLSPAKPE